MTILRHIIPPIIHLSPRRVRQPFILLQKECYFERIS